MKLTNLLKPTNLNFTFRVLLIFMPDVYFLVEERSDRASKAGQVFQPVQACKPSKPTAPAYFWGVKLMFGGPVNFGHNVCWCMNFGKVQKIMFVVVKLLLVIFYPIFSHLDSVKWTSLQKLSLTNNAHLIFLFCVKLCFKIYNCKLIKT